MGKADQETVDQSYLSPTRDFQNRFQYCGPSAAEWKTFVLRSIRMRKCLVSSSKVCDDDGGRCPVPIEVVRRSRYLLPGGISGGLAASGLSALSHTGGSGIMTRVRLTLCYTRQRGPFEARTVSPLTLVRVNTSRTAFFRQSQSTGVISPSFFRIPCFDEHAHVINSSAPWCSRRMKSEGLKRPQPGPFPVRRFRAPFEASSAATRKKCHGRFDWHLWAVRSGQNPTWRISLLRACARVVARASTAGVKDICEGLAN